MYHIPLVSGFSGRDGRLEWGKLVDAKSFTIFMKILLIFMGVITPLCGLSLFINAKGESAVRQELDKSLESRTAYFAGMLETEFDRAIVHLRSFLFDKDLQKWIYAHDSMDRYAWGETVLRIQEKLKIIKMSSVYIRSVSVQSLWNDQSISSEYAIGPVDKKAAEAFLAQFERTRSPILFYEGRLLLGHVYPDVILVKKPSDYIVFIELSVAELRKALGQFTNYEHAGAALLGEGGDWSIASAGGEIVREIVSSLQGEIGDMPRNVVSRRIGAESYLIFHQDVPAMNTSLLIYVPEKAVLGELDSYRIWFWLLSVVSMVIIAIFAFTLYRFIHRPLNKLVLSFRRVEDGYLEPTNIPRGRDEFRYLFEHFNSMVAKIKDLIHRLYEQEIRTKESELKQLQSQINPHFLYNTYFILHRLAKMDDLETVILFSRQLGEYFQFITRSGEAEIPLEQEWNHAKLYVDIQQIRFSNRIEVEFDPLPEELREVRVPKLIIQPIVENAYKYGMERKGEEGLIAVGIRRDNDTIQIHVEDNGPGLVPEALARLQADLEAPQADGEVTGIRNVHRRLRAVYGEGSGIRIRPGKAGGLRVELIINLTR